MLGWLALQAAALTHDSSAFAPSQCRRKLRPKGDHHLCGALEDRSNLGRGRLAGRERWPTSSTVFRQAFLTSLAEHSIRAWSFGDEAAEICAVPLQAVRVAFLHVDLDLPHGALERLGPG